jgi:hypothetical protein
MQSSVGLLQRHLLRRCCGGAPPAAGAGADAGPHHLGLAPLPELLALLHVDVALGERRRVPVGVVAHRVEHLPLPPPPHLHPLPRRHDGVLRRHQLELGARAPVVLVRAQLLELQRRWVVAPGGGGRAAAEHEVGEVGREGPALVVDLVAAVVGGPGGAVPDGGVERHGLGRVVAAHGAGAGHLADRHAVHVEDDHAGGPEDGEAVRLQGRVEGHQVPLLAATVGAAVAVHVRLQPPLVPPPVAKELEVKLVVVLLEDVAVGQLQPRIA